MTPILENLQFVLPEIIILTSACAVLLGDLFLRQRYPNIGLISVSVGLLLAAIVSILLLDNDKSIILGGMFVSDNLAQLMKLFIYLSVFLSLIYSIDYIAERKFPVNDYYALGLLSTLGMMIVVSAHSLLTIFLAVELLSLPIYAMCAIWRHNNFAVEAALKYFIMGAIASAILLYGLSILYGATGTLNLLELTNIIPVNWANNYALLTFALVFIITGVGFKLAVFPFHMWAPDVYEGAPTSVSMFISAAPKIAALGMTFRLLSSFVDLTTQWQQLILILSILSVIVGNLLAIVQTNIKRLLAYSSIAHAGYALFGVLVATPTGFAVALYYIVAYALMVVAAFGLLVLLSQNGREIEYLDDLKGLNKQNPWLAFMMLIVLFSLAGVPPGVGFITKLLVLKALIDVNMTWVAVIGLLFAVVGAFYYIKIIKIMYFDDSDKGQLIQLSLPIQVIFSLNCLSLLYLGIFPAYLVTACNNAFA